MGEKTVKTDSDGFARYPIDFVNLTYVIDESYDSLRINNSRPLQSPFPVEIFFFKEEEVNLLSYEPQWRATIKLNSEIVNAVANSVQVYEKWYYGKQGLSPNSGVYFYMEPPVAWFYAVEKGANIKPLLIPYQKKNPKALPFDDYVNQRQSRGEDVSEFEVIRELYTHLMENKLPVDSYDIKIHVYNKADLDILNFDGFKYEFKLGISIDYRINYFPEQLKDLQEKVHCLIRRAKG